MYIRSNASSLSPLYPFLSFVSWLKVFALYWWPLVPILNCFEPSCDQSRMYIFVQAKDASCCKVLQFCNLCSSFKNLLMLENVEQIGPNMRTIDDRKHLVTLAAHSRTCWFKKMANKFEEIHLLSKLKAQILLIKQNGTSYACTF